MSGYEIATIVLAVVTLMAGVSWLTIISRAKSLVRNLKDIKDEYQAAIANGVISEDEKARIVQEAIEVMEDAISLWQNLVNLALQLRKLILRR